MKHLTYRLAYLFIKAHPEFLAFRESEGLFWGYQDGKLTAMTIAEWHLLACERMGVGMVIRNLRHIPRKLTVEDQRATDWRIWPNPLWCAKEAVRMEPWYIRVLHWFGRILTSRR